VSDGNVSQGNQPPDLRPPSSVLRLPIRWRLTLWYAALLAVVMAFFSGALYLALRQQLYASLDEQLLNQAALTLASVRITEGTPQLNESVADLPDGEYFLRLLDAAGHPIVETESDPPIVTLDPGAAAAALAGESVYTNAVDEDQEVVRVVSVPVHGAGVDAAVVGALQIGLDRNEIDEPLAGLLTALAFVGPIVLLVAAIAGYFLAGRALAPVGAIGDLAARIGASDLHARLNLDLPDDELGRLARAFDAMLARIDDAFERQRRFTADAAHELRTPLSLMRSQVDVALARPRTNEEYREALRGFDGDLARLTSLVGTLLTLARADAGRLTLQHAPFDVSDTVAAVLEHYAPQAEEAGVMLNQETVAAPLVADEDLIMQILVNLVDNALAHTPVGGVVTVGCRSERGYVRIWVADTGEGIAPEDQAQVFDRFYRVDAGRTRARGGTGLGLAICKAIAEAHGGKIAMRSEVGRGTRIEVVLPDTP
jgi:heavy metal sensor kinase